MIGESDISTGSSYTKPPSPTEKSTSKSLKSSITTLPSTLSKLSIKSFQRK
jgi:hypothetical protein